jgi:hypothetical protein
VDQTKKCLLKQQLNGAFYGLFGLKGNGELRLETVYDWVTVAIFAGLVVLFLQRSSQEEPQDKLYEYMPPSVGCALANYFGNENLEIVAIPLIVGILAYIHYVLKPFSPAESED